MNADPTSSGPKYIKQAQEAGLIAIETKPAEDRRKDLIEPTAKMVSLVEDALNRVGTSEGRPSHADNEGAELTEFLKSVAYGSAIEEGPLVRFYREGRRKKCVPLYVVRGGIVTNEVAFIPFARMHEHLIGGPQLRTRLHNGRHLLKVRQLFNNTWTSPRHIEYWALPVPRGWTEYDIFGAQESGKPDKSEEKLRQLNLPKQ
jgi:hypothetical protein